MNLSNVAQLFHIGNKYNPYYSLVRIINIQESPYIDFTVAHPYPTQSGSNLTQQQTESLIDQYISDAHNILKKPFIMEEFNVSGVDRAQWWSNMMAEIEKAVGDGDCFWWYDNLQIKAYLPAWKRQCPDPDAGSERHTATNNEKMENLMETKYTRERVGTTSCIDDSPNSVEDPTQ